MARGGHVPPENFRPSEIAFLPFWGETARVGRPTANLVIVFETLAPEGRLSFHPISCGTALFGHVTSGATYTAYNQVGSGESLVLTFCCQLAIRQSHGEPRLDSCSMGLTILSALVRDVV